MSSQLTSLGKSRPKTSKRSSGRSHPLKAGTRAMPQPGILDGVRDQHGDCWIKYGTEGQFLWFRIGDLVLPGNDVIHRLIKAGARVLSPAKRAGFIKSIEDWDQYRDALVASRPGWLDQNFIFGNGQVLSPDDNDKEIIVSFRVNEKFTEVGSFDQWKASVGPLVTKQTLPLFALAIGCCAPLIRFAPSGYLNPLFEIVGRPECGKSIIAALAASIWAGDPNSDCGGGVGWDVTLNALDDLKSQHRDSLLFLDEGNLAGASIRDRKDIIQQATFKLAGSGSRIRKGDTSLTEHTSLSVLSTTNSPLSELVEGTSHVRNAAQSRMITIRIPDNRPLGALSVIPEGYQTSREAVEALRAAIDESYGVAGRAFMKRLVAEVSKDEDAFRNWVQSALRDHTKRVRYRTTGSARADKTFALVAVAGRLARKWEIIPKSWGAADRAVRRVQRNLLQPKAAPLPTACERILQYASQHKNEFLYAVGLAKPCSKAEFAQAWGVIGSKNGRMMLFVDAVKFQEEFPDYKVVLRELRGKNLIHHEGGKHSKLTAHAPSNICPKKRAYCIYLSNWTKSK